MAASASCGPPADDEPRVERSRRDGVEHVLLSGPDTDLGWEIAPDLVIAPEDEGVLRFAGVAPWEVSGDRDGRVYVLDRSAGRVVVFGRTGRIVGTLGRTGEGPGELSEPMALAVSASGSVAVMDYGKGSVVRWPAGGGAPASVRLERPFWGPGLGLTSWAVLYPALAADGREERAVQLVAVGESRTGVLAELNQHTVAASFRGCGIGGIPVEPIFEPQLQWSAAGESVVVTSGPRYEVRVFERGVLARVIEREVPSRPASRELALREVAGGLELTAPVRCRIGPEEVVEARGFAAEVPAVAGLAIAPDGTIWVGRGRVGDEPPRVDVLAADGSYLGTLPSGAPLPAAFAGGARDYRPVAVRTTEADETEVVLYRVRR